MRNLKKIIAVVVTLVMLLSVATFAASAASEPTLALYGKAETGLTKGQGYYELAVHLTDAGNTVGGIEGAITYDTNVFNYVDAQLNANFVAAGNPEEAAVVACTDDNGVVKFVGLNNAESVGEWFVLRFEVVAAGSANFAFTAVKGANTEGYVTVNVVGDSTVATDADVLNVAGATIKDNKDGDAQDIAFRVVVDSSNLPEGRTVKEYGLLLMYTKRLGYGELTYDMIKAQELGQVTGLVWAKVDAAAVSTEYAVNLNNMKANQLGVKVSARAFAVLDDGSVVYSKNYNSLLNTKSGYESKSVIDVARAAARKIIDESRCTDEEEIKTIEAILELKSIYNDDRATLLEFVTNYL